MIVKMLWFKDQEKLRKALSIGDEFGPNCTFSVHSDSVAAINARRLKLKVLKIGDHAVMVDNVRLTIAAATGDITILVGGSNIELNVARGVIGHYDFRLWDDSSVAIGEKTTSNGTKIVAEESTVSIGRDCMFSDGVILQASDQHAIVDLKLGQIINNSPTSLVIHDHVWLGRCSSVMYNTIIGRGSIVGFGSLVTRSVDPFCLAVGRPASVIKKDVTWSRQRKALDDYSAASIDQYQTTQAGNLK